MSNCNCDTCQAQREVERLRAELAAALQRLNEAIERDLRGACAAEVRQ